MKQNLDTDPDYLLLQHQGQRIPIPTRLAIDDGENIYGGNITSGGTASAGAAASASLTNQQNFSQIQENPFPGCLAHWTPLPLLEDGKWITARIQDVRRGDILNYRNEYRKVFDVVRSWCDDIWEVNTHQHIAEFGCSPTHRIVQNLTDYGGTAVQDLTPESTWLVETETGELVEDRILLCEATGVAGWVYQVTLEGDAPEDHWFMAAGAVQENAKPTEDQR